MTTYQRKQDVMSRSERGESVIIDLDAGEFYGLGDVGTIVWEALAQPQSIPQLVQAVTKHFDVSPHQCESDITVLLAELESTHLIERRA